MTIICSGKETKATWTYGKKAVGNANEGTEAAKEPTGFLTVFMPLGVSKQAINKCGFYVNRFVENLNIS